MSTPLMMVEGVEVPETKINWRGKSVIVKPKKESRKARKKRLRDEKVKLLLDRDEKMNQDLERFLMEIEERNSWIACELNERNFLTMKKTADVATILRGEISKLKVADSKQAQENGLAFFRGNIVSDKKLQNSAAKHLDLLGHIAPVSSCKLSKCLQYVLSCSTDKTTRLWLLHTGRSILIYSGHLKKVNDCDLHPEFVIKDRLPCVVTCSGDCTIRFWNSFSEKSLKVLKGHTEPVYRVSFSPNGRSIVSCSEDYTVRTWSFPEGFQLHIFRAHMAPVYTVQFSPSGRYFDIFI
jgi:WD40 repeat protein